MEVFKYIFYIGLLAIAITLLLQILEVHNDTYKLPDDEDDE